MTGSTADKCQGPNGYALNVLYDDRMSINVITPDNQEVDLNYWQIIATGFSSITGQAQWRVKTVNDNLQPVALITQFNVIDNSNIDNPQQQSYYVISKITKHEICIVDKVDKSQTDADNQAILLADDAVSKSCLPRLE